MFSALAALVAVEVVLFVTSSAVLVRSSGPAYRGGARQESLVCTYFTGAGLLDEEFWYSPDGIVGRVACPRIVGF